MNRLPALLAHTRFVLTGPSGWIGQAMCAQLARAIGGPIGRRVTAFGSHARDLTLASGEVLAVRPVASITPADVAGAHVIHLGWPGKEQAALLGEAGFVAAHRAIDAALLAAMAQARPASLFFASSGAAALAERGQDMHPYGTGKLAAEERYLAFAREAGVPMVAGRIFSLAGPHINKLDSYALACFALGALCEGVIRIEAAVPVFRSFLHVNDLCAMILAALLGGVSRPRPIDLCGAEVVEMSDLAHVVARAVGGTVALTRPPLDLNRPSAYLGDFTDTKLFAMALAMSLTGLDRQVADTVNWLHKTGAGQNDSLAGASQYDSKAGGRSLHAAG